MLAEDFGYQLSPKPAKAMTPKIQEEVDKALNDAANTTSRSSSRDGFAGFVVLLSVILAFALQELWIFLVGLALMAVLMMTTTKAKAAEGKLREMTTPVLAGRWQAWPCRMEAVVGQARRRVLLLDPEGVAAVAFLSAVPDDAWLDMTDGRGLVWFVGDLRFGGIMALPGGSPIWWTGTPVVSQKQTESSGGLHQVVEEELARQAVKFVFDKWLK